MGITNPIVSVCMITYGHELYIKEAIEGVLMQECDFSFELIIADDCSPDKTTDVVEDIIKNHPRGDLINYTRHEKNKGVIDNFIWALNQCTCKYIAICEGDDFWTNPLKLQKQVDFLEANKDFALSFHQVSIERDGVLEDDFMHNPEDITTVFDLAEGLYIRTLSVVFCNEIYKKLTNSQKKSITGDYSLFLILAEYGTMKYFDEVMGVYRIHDGGVWSKADEVERQTGALLRLIGSYNYFDHDEKVQSVLYKNIQTSIFNLLNNLLVTENKEHFTALLKKLMKVNPKLMSMLFYDYSVVNYTNYLNLKESKRYKLGNLLLSPIRLLKSINK